MRNIRKNKKDMHGRPVTAQRQLLLSLIKKAGGHISAKELYKRASIKTDSISLATVYRSLRLFKELGLIEERRLGQLHCYYELKDVADHQHMVCRSCGKVIEIESPLVGKLVEELVHKHGLSLTKVELYMEGYCRECSKGARERVLAGEALGIPRGKINGKKSNRSISGKNGKQK